MIENKSKYKIIGVFSVTSSLLILLYTIFQYKIGAITKSGGMYLAALGMIPSLSFVVFYSLRMGETFTKGQKVIKSKNPRLYYLITSFWCILLFLDVVYLLFKTLN